MNNSYPKIGIRPIIDGRRQGVRESLEEMTMGLAHRVAKLYSDTLRYPDGSPVECVIADTCIGGVKEAANCADKFARAGVGVSLSVTPCHIRFRMCNSILKRWDVKLPICLLNR